MNNPQKEKEKDRVTASSLDGKTLESLQAESLIDPNEYEIELDENISLESLLAELEEEDKKAETENASKVSESSQQNPQGTSGTGSLPHTELMSVRSTLKKVETEKQELMELFQRRQADFENFRKRVTRDQSESFNRIASEIVKKLLPVIDNLQRALEVQKTIDSSANPEFHNFVQGIGLISDQLNNVLDNLGVKPVPSVGEPFDPHIHEAVATELSDEFAPDTVTEELQRGYRLGDTLIRPAMVKVAAKN